jgi:hypothetical protein
VYFLSIGLIGLQLNRSGWNMKRRKLRSIQFGLRVFKVAAKRRLCQPRRALHTIGELRRPSFREVFTKINRHLDMNIRKFFGGAPFLAVLIGSLTALGTETSVVPEPGDLRAAGAVDFPVSCAPAVRSEFMRGVALLHSFFYEEARRIFTAVAEKDPTSAMAQWGIAMTWWHPIWTPPSLEEMRAGKAASDQAVAMTAGTDRERRFITALNAYYNTPDRAGTGVVGQSCHGPVGPRERVIAYEKAMRKLSDRYPDDFEAQTFYALAILAVGYATPADTTLSNQLQAAGILEKLWKKNPNHPGVTHYLIHSYDYPALAERGLAAARTYGSIAPWVPHALHMPSHIFTRLGMWDESIAANRNAAVAARAYAVVRHRDATEAEELHALDYMAYSYLQEAQDTKAKEIVDFAATVRKTNPELEFQRRLCSSRYSIALRAGTQRLGRGGRTAHSCIAALVFISLHGGADRVCPRPRASPYRRPRRGTQRD